MACGVSWGSKWLSVLSDQSTLFRICGFDAKKIETYVKADFARIAAGFGPEADREGCRTYCDWMNWVCAILTVNPRLINQGLRV